MSPLEASAAVSQPKLSDTSKPPLLVAISASCFCSSGFETVLTKMEFWLLLNWVAILSSVVAP